MIAHRMRNVSHNISHFCQLFIMSVSGKVANDLGITCYDPALTEGTTPSQARCLTTGTHVGTTTRGMAGSSPCSMKPPPSASQAHAGHWHGIYGFGTVLAKRKKLSNALPRTGGTFPSVISMKNRFAPPCQENVVA
jgi:hypothetical protein